MLLCSNFRQASATDCEKNGRKVDSLNTLIYSLSNNMLLPCCRNYGIHMTRDIFPYLPDIGAKKSDIIMFNFGVWHNDMTSFVGNLSEVHQYLTERRDKMPYLIWRDVGPQHFDTPLGEFACDGCPAPQYPFECKVGLVIL